MWEYYPLRSLPFLSMPNPWGIIFKITLKLIIQKDTMQSLFLSFSDIINTISKIIRPLSSKSTHTIFTTRVSARKVQGNWWPLKKEVGERQYNAKGQFQHYKVGIQLKPANNIQALSSGDFYTNTTLIPSKTRDTREPSFEKRIN